MFLRLKSGVLEFIILESSIANAKYRQGPGKIFGAIRGLQKLWGLTVPITGSEQRPLSRGQCLDNWRQKLATMALTSSLWFRDWPQCVYAAAEEWERGWHQRTFWVSNQLIAPPGPCQGPWRTEKPHYCPSVHC